MTTIINASQGKLAAAQQVLPPQQQQQRQHDPRQPPPSQRGRRPPGTGTYPKTSGSGYYRVRAVVSPNFPSYLQAALTATPWPGVGDAYLLLADTAGQFNMVDGQLVYDVPGGKSLYMSVENPAEKTQRKLAKRFDVVKNTYGTFAFQGDTLTWTVADIKRPNAAAWLVCGAEKRPYINTGAYAYDTPQGCAYQTIHSYGGSTANI